MVRPGARPAPAPHPRPIRVAPSASPRPVSAPASRGQRPVAAPVRPAARPSVHAPQRPAPAPVRRPQAVRTQPAVRPVPQDQYQGYDSHRQEYLQQELIQQPYQPTQLPLPKRRNPFISFLKGLGVFLLISGLVAAIGYIWLQFYA